MRNERASKVGIWKNEIGPPNKEFGSESYIYSEMLSEKDFLQTPIN